MKTALLKQRPLTSGSVDSWVQQKRHAALAVARNGQILAANSAAMIAFGVREGESILHALVASDSNLADLLSSVGGTPKITQVRCPAKNAVHTAVLQSLVGYGSDCVTVITDFYVWPLSLSQLLRSTYRLTATEIEVLQALMLGQTANEVAGTTSRGIATVRTHIRPLLEKTGARTQLELLRLCLGLMTITVEAAPLRPASSSAPPNGSSWRRDNVFKTLKLPDGRDRAYIETGDPMGRPFVLFPSPLGLFRFPRAVEIGLARDHLRLLAPLRSSLGPSSLPPRHRPVIESFATDCIALMDALAIERVPVVCLGMDLLHGVTLANMAPDRVSAVIGAGAMLPVTEPEHMARLEATARFIFKNTRYLPRITNIMTYAFLYMGHLAGPGHPLRSMLKSSPVDQALLDVAEVLDAMTLGSPYNHIPNFAVHEACSCEVEAFVSDWRDALINCRRPVVLLTGDSSPWNPLETMNDFAARSANIRPIVLPDTGLMVAHQRPEVMLREVKLWL